MILQKGRFAIGALVIFLAGCGGGGGSSGGSGEGNAGSLRSGLKTKDAGLGSPFKSLDMIVGLEPRINVQNCKEDDYLSESAMADCVDKSYGFFKGRPPSPAKAIPDGEDTYVTEDVSREDLGSGFSVKENYIYLFWQADNETYDGEATSHSEFLPGNEIFLRFNTSGFGINGREEPFKNTLSTVSSSQTPGSRGRLTISVDTSAGMVEVCRDEGPVDDLFCGITPEDMEGIRGVSSGQHEIRFAALDEILGLEKRVEVNARDNLAGDFVTDAAKNISGFGTTRELSAEELTFNPFSRFGWEVKKDDERYSMQGGWDFMRYREGGESPATGLPIESGYVPVHGDAPPYTVFVYIPNLDVTVFGHGGVSEDEEGERRHDWLPYFALLPKGDQDFYNNKKKFTKIIEQFGDIETQIYYGDLRSRDVINGNIPEANKKFRWSEARSTQLNAIPPDPDAGSGSGGGSGSGEDALGGSQVSFTFQCSTPGSTPSTVNVSQGVCRSQQENYAETFGCNDLDNFYQSCTNLYSCAANNSTGDYKDYYDEYLGTCDYYRP